MKTAATASTTFAVDSMTRLATELSLREKYDIRPEAAAAKEWATVRGWHVVDQTMQTPTLANQRAAGCGPT
jgi:hypothetical protein